MAKTRSSGSTLFLMELVVVLFFFSVFAAIFVTVFGSAQQMAQDSRNLSSAVLVARSGASCYKASDGQLSQVADLLDGTLQDGDVQVYYDKDWQPAQSPEPDGFCLHVTAGNIAGEADIVVQTQNDDSEIYRLQVKCTPGGELYE